MNRARSLMQMPVEPVLEGGDEEADGSAEMPPAKRPKSGRVVQRAIVVESLGVAPPQTVSYLFHLILLLPFLELEFV